MKGIVGALVFGLDAGFKGVCYIIGVFSDDSVVKILPEVQELLETPVWSLSLKDPLEEGVATHSSVLAWRIPWTEKPGGLQSMGSQRVKHDWRDLVYCIINV